MLNKQQQQQLKAATFPYNVKPTLWLTKNRPFFFQAESFTLSFCINYGLPKQQKNAKQRQNTKQYVKKLERKNFHCYQCHLNNTYWSYISLRYSVNFLKPKQGKKYPSDSALDSGLKGPSSSLLCRDRAGYKRSHQPVTRCVLKTYYFSGKVQNRIAN